jgi:DUF4097 and DUF4098 domain-containing protein YvlB
MFTRRRAGEVVLVLGVCVFALAADQAKKEFRFTVGPKASVTINNEFGPVSVKPSGSNQVVVTATLQSDKVEVDNTSVGNRIVLKSHMLDGAKSDNASVEYEVLVPADASVFLRSMSGPIHAEQLRGDVTAEGDTAEVDVRDISNAHVHVNTLTGPITLTHIENGHVEISSVKGDVVLNSVSGPLVAVTSSSGKISYNGDFGVGGDYRLSSHTGDIEAIVPETASVDVTARSVRGSVENDFPLQPKSHTTFLPEKGHSFVGTAGKAASSVLLRTISGKIRLKKR